jgi:hypothetical protein
MCARCRIRLRDEDCQGESGLYSPNRPFTLCEPCFEDEDREIDLAGQNEIPQRLTEYRENLRAGSLPFRAGRTELKTELLPSLLDPRPSAELSSPGDK